MKATGLGLSLGLKNFEIFPDGDVISVKQTVDSNEWHFHEYSFDDEYACTVCGLSDSFEKEVRVVSIKDVVERVGVY